MTKALAIAAFGARGTGKTAWVRQQLQAMAPQRLIVWDYKHDPSLRDVGRPFTDLAAFLQAMAAPTFALRYLVNHDRPIHDWWTDTRPRQRKPGQFSIFCQAAYQVGNLTMFVDELGEVTMASRAPAAWKKCVNVGRDYQVDGQRKALTIIGASQRPSEVDKTFVANCDVIHSGRLGDIKEAAVYAGSWGIEPARLANMPDLAWVERRATEPQPIHGVLTFGNAKPPPKPREVKKRLPLATPPKGVAPRGSVR